MGRRCGWGERGREKGQEEKVRKEKGGRSPSESSSRQRHVRSHRAPPRERVWSVAVAFQLRQHAGEVRDGPQQGADWPEPAERRAKTPRKEAGFFDGPLRKKNIEAIGRRARREQSTTLLCFFLRFSPGKEIQKRTSPSESPGTSCARRLSKKARLFYWFVLLRRERKR